MDAYAGIAGTWHCVAVDLLSACRADLCWDRGADVICSFLIETV